MRSRRYKKKDFPAENVRHFLEPGPVILISSAWDGQLNIMTCGWHMVMGDGPGLVGCFLWTQDHSREMIERSKECVINVPTVEIARTVVAIGNTTGGDLDKFAKFGLTAEKAAKVKAPLIGECYANFECKLVNTDLSRKYSLFVFEVVKGHAATSPKYPKTIHYRGGGQFMVSGAPMNLRRLFKPQML